LSNNAAERGVRCSALGRKSWLFCGSDSGGERADGSVHAQASISVTGTFTGTAQGGTSTPFRTVQPTIVCNYIMRII
jgi:hypothetical protein